jgi:hypothetical protein
MRAVVLATLTFPLLGALLGCPGAGNDAGGADGGADGGALRYPKVGASGKVELHPDALAFLADAGLTPPSVEGLRLELVDPLLAASQDPQAVFAEQTLGAEGGFSASGLDTAQWSLGLAARTFAPDGGLVVPSATVLYDTLLAQGVPQGDLAGLRAYALPVPFVDQLSLAVGVGRVGELTDGGHATLAQAGFVLGKVVDAAGAPIEGAKLEIAEPAGRPERLLYPDLSLAGAGQGGTAAHGLFLFVHHGGPHDAFQFTLEGRPEYRARNAAVASGGGLVLWVYPGPQVP